MKKILGSAIVQEIKFDSIRERDEYIHHVTAKAERHAQDAVRIIRLSDDPDCISVQIAKPYNFNSIPDFVKRWCESCSLET